MGVCGCGLGVWVVVGGELGGRVGEVSGGVRWGCTGVACWRRGSIGRTCTAVSSLATSPVVSLPSCAFDLDEEEEEDEAAAAPGGGVGSWPSLGPLSTVFRLNAIFINDDLGGCCCCVPPPLPVLPVAVPGGGGWVTLDEYLSSKRYVTSRSTGCGNAFKRSICACFACNASCAVSNSALAAARSAWTLRHWSSTSSLLPLLPLLLAEEVAAAAALAAASSFGRVVVSHSKRCTSRALGLTRET